MFITIDGDYHAVRNFSQLIEGRLGDKGYHVEQWIVPYGRIDLANKVPARIYQIADHVTDDPATKSTLMLACRLSMFRALAEREKMDPALVVILHGGPLHWYGEFGEYTAVARKPYETMQSALAEYRWPDVCIRTGTQRQVDIIEFQSICYGAQIFPLNPGTPDGQLLADFMHHVRRNQLLAVLSTA